MMHIPRDNPAFLPSNLVRWFSQKYSGLFSQQLIRKRLSVHCCFLLKR